MSPIDYLNSLSGLRRVRFLLAANKANRSALDHAAVCLADQQRADAINAAMRDHGHCMRVLARNAERHGRLMAVTS